MISLHNPETKQLLIFLYLELYTNADLEIYRCLYLHIKVMYRRFRIIETFTFELCTSEIYEMFVYKHTETTEYVKK